MSIIEDKQDRVSMRRARAAFDLEQEATCKPQYSTASSQPEVGLNVAMPHLPQADSMLTVTEYRR